MSLIFPFTIFLLISIAFSTNLCTNPVYIISLIDGKSLDLESFICNNWAKSEVIMNHNYPTWCVSDNGTFGPIRYNGMDGTCGIQLYGSNANYFLGIFPRAMMNWNNLVWSVNVLGNGLFKIVSPFNGNNVLTWDGEALTLEPFELGSKKQSWIMLPNTN